MTTKAAISNEAVREAARAYCRSYDIDPDFPHGLNPGAPLSWEVEAPHIRAAIEAVNTPIDAEGLEREFWHDLGYPPDERWTRQGIASALKHLIGEVAALVSRPSAALPGRDDGEVVAMRLETTAENIARDIKEGRFPEQSKPKMVPDVLDAWDRIGADDRLALARKKLSMHELRLIIQHTEAALVSQPHPEGEVVADRASLVWAFRNGASWQQANPDEPIGSIRVAAEEWANAPYPLPAPTLQGAGLIEALRDILALCEAGGDPFSEPGRPTLNRALAALSPQRGDGK